MDTRESKAEALVLEGGIERLNETFYVPSQSGKASYTVTLGTAGERCTCPDHQFRGRTCKHILAARKAREETIH
jgi:hypothetical protein